MISEGKETFLNFFRSVKSVAAYIEDLEDRLASAEQKMVEIQENQRQVQNEAREDLLEMAMKGKGECYELIWKWKPEGQEVQGFCLEHFKSLRGHSWTELQRKKERGEFTPDELRALKFTNNFKSWASTKKKK